MAQGIIQSSANAPGFAYNAVYGPMHNAPQNIVQSLMPERTKRATGGRIPHADKLFNEAKKTLDNQTKPMLNVHDDAIVHALRIAQGRV